MGGFMLVFGCTDGSLSGPGGYAGQEIYFSDGSADGTYLVKDLTPTTYSIAGKVYPNNSYPRHLTVLGDRVYFRAEAALGNSELWSSDGTAVGTVLVAELKSGSSGSAPRNLHAVGGCLVFAADDGSHGVEYWVHDPVAGTTTLLADIKPGSGSCTDYPQAENRCIGAVVNGRLYFQADDGVHGGELWSTAGTSASTRRETDINPSGAASTTQSDFRSMSAFGGKVYLAATNGPSGREPWVFDPATGQATLLSDLNPGPAGSDPDDLVVCGNTLFFSADDGLGSRSLFATDGVTVARVPGSDGINPMYPVAVGSTLCFRAWDATHGIELWEARTSGASLVFDATPGTLPGWIGGELSDISRDWVAAMAACGGTLYFSARTPEAGEELWAYTPDGSATTRLFRVDVRRDGTTIDGGASLDGGTPQALPATFTGLQPTADHTAGFIIPVGGAG